MYREGGKPLAKSLTKGNSKANRERREKRSRRKLPAGKTTFLKVTKQRGDGGKRKSGADSPKLALWSYWNTGGAGMGIIF